MSWISEYLRMRWCVVHTEYSLHFMVRKALRRGESVQIFIALCFMWWVIPPLDVRLTLKQKPGHLSHSCCQWTWFTVLQSNRTLQFSSWNDHVHLCHMIHMNYVMLFAFLSSQKRRGLVAGAGRKSGYGLFLTGLKLPQVHWINQVILEISYKAGSS